MRQSILLVFQPTGGILACMADPRQLEIIGQGVDRWNRWRKENYGQGIDLSGADLRGAQLSGVNLTEANLRGVDLTEAKLGKAHLRGADLTGAKLSRAYLAVANLTRAVLNRADLSEALLGETVFGDADLNYALGLNSCSHFAPSILDHRTLARSGRLPLAFLRGCGLSETLITYLPSILNEPIQFYSCFISYSNRDQEFADRLHADLQNMGVRCWFASHDVQGGRKIHEQIDEAIRLHDRLLLILSDASMASEWVKTEIAHARQKEFSQKRQVLFPVTLVPFTAVQEWKCFDADSGNDSAREIREYFIPDFSNWKNYDQYQRAFDRLLKDLRS
jgi:uncharacterized protein YjbI with pentapeptide repeats